jgi:hypothetical protein
MPTQRIRVTVAKAGFRSVEREIALVSGEASEVTIALERERRRPNDRPSAPRRPTSNEPGRLTFNATPWCNVSVDGRNAGQTPVVNFALSPGRHTVVCVNPQAGTRRVTINVDPGETVRRSIRF